MILCPRCLHKINKEVYEVAEDIRRNYNGHIKAIIVFKCPSCRQEITNLTARLQQIYYSNYTIP